MNAPILVKGTIEYAEWLADKLHCTNDYGKEAAELLVQQAKKLVTKATFEASRMRLFARATGHPMVLEIMADCADAIDTENSAQHDTDVGPYDGSQWVALAAELRQRAAAIRAEDPDIWTTNDKLPQGEPLTRDQIRDMVKECGLDWHRGFVPLFAGDDTNRYEVLVREAVERFAASQASLKPLGYEQIVAIWQEHMKTRALPNYEDFTRAIERAHGIGVKP